MSGPVKSLTKGIFKASGGWILDAAGDALGFNDKIKMPPPPPGVPTIDDAAENQSQRDAMRRRRGRAASILTSPTGVGSTPVGSKTLLGA